MIHELILSGAKLIDKDTTPLHDERPDLIGYYDQDTVYLLMGTIKSKIGKTFGAEALSGMSMRQVYDQMANIGLVDVPKVKPTYIAGEGKTVRVLPVSRKMFENYNSEIETVEVDSVILDGVEI